MKQYDEMPKIVYAEISLMSQGTDSYWQWLEK